MSAQKIETRCPVCNSAYRIQAASVGHRARCPKCDSVFRVVVLTGRQSETLPSSPHPDAPEPAAPAALPSRSTELPPNQSTEPRPHKAANRSPRESLEPSPHRPADSAPHSATEDDILRWLTESKESDELPLEPRWWEGPPKPTEKASA